MSISPNTNTQIDLNMDGEGPSPARGLFCNSISWGSNYRIVASLIHNSPLTSDCEAGNANCNLLCRSDKVLELFLGALSNRQMTIVVEKH